MKESPRTFIFSAVLYSLTLVLGIIIARLYVGLGRSGTDAPTLALVESRGFLITIAFVVVLLYLMRIIYSRHVALSLLLLTTVAIGTYYAVDAFQVLPPGSFIIAMVIVCLATIIPTVITHDLGIMFGIAGISALLGTTMTPAVAILIMVVMAVYDFSSVASGRTVGYASRMLESGAVFGFIIPRHFSGFFQRRNKALRGGTVVLLGSIDVSLPLLLTSAIAKEPLVNAILIAVGALGGLLVAHLALFRRRKDSYLAALPPIASSSIFGFLAKRLLLF